MMKKMVAIALLGVVSCSDAGFEGYGPIGQGVLGSAYGYSERQLNAGVWLVEYVGSDAAEARQGALRRANELCQQQGYGSADFKPGVFARTDLLVASGQAKCLKPGQVAAPAARTIADRILEIDAEISALNAELITSQAPGSATGTGALDIFTTGLNQVSTASINRKIARLQAERAALLRGG